MMPLCFRRYAQVNPARPAPTTTTRALVATRVVPNSDDGKASPAVVVEIVRINSRRDMAESSAGASRPSDWAAVAAAWRRSLARGVCAIMKLVVSRRDCIVLREGLQYRVSYTRLYLAIGQARAGFGKHVLQYRDRGDRIDRCC